MKARSTLVYTVLRLLAFLVPFGLLMLLPIMQQYYWLAAIFAALIGLSLSILFLRRPLEGMSTSIAESRARAKAPVTDEDVEDAAIEADGSADATADRSIGADGSTDATADQSTAGEASDSSRS